jgi:hypothetical protein
MATPDCYKCVHRRNVPGDAHSGCANSAARVTGNSHGIRMGWFLWPANFDPVWLETCDGFSDNPGDATTKAAPNIFEAISTLLRK